MMYRIPGPDGGEAFVRKVHPYRFEPTRTYRQKNGRKYMVPLLPHKPTREMAENSLQTYALQKGWECV